MSSTREPNDSPVVRQSLTYPQKNLIQNLPGAPIMKCKYVLPNLNKLAAAVNFRKQNVYEQHSFNGRPSHEMHSSVHTRHTILSLLKNVNF